MAQAVGKNFFGNKDWYLWDLNELQIASMLEVT